MKLSKFLVSAVCLLAFPLTATATATSSDVLTVDHQYERSQLEHSVSSLVFIDFNITTTYTVTEHDWMVYRDGFYVDLVDDETPFVGSYRVTRQPNVKGAPIVI